ncbi:hypothetical protein GpartN1_g4511.t1 [Galdieria partita]|uniref:Dienelactone hydrolase domain-containing protein n=1 Tax=Galdieria partita TaxID=83374 RepID=A0A9C7PYD3_9RHOD|nr:hypothetical protein GpartN1_g4511.t1 [Galdieria partita]
MSRVTLKKEVEVTAYIFGENHKASYGIVVLHEIWGVNYTIRALAQELSDFLNCKVLLPDLFAGKVARHISEATRIRSLLDWSQVLSDIGIAVRFLRDRQHCRNVAVVGYSLGGALALTAAAAVNGLDCCVCFYGIPPRQLCDVRKISVPIQLHFGEKDQAKGFTDLEEAMRLEEELKLAGVNHELFIYPRAGHGFMSRPDQYDIELADSVKQRILEQYDPESRHLAFQRMISFFMRHFDTV